MSTDMFPDSFIEYVIEKHDEEKNMADHGDNYTRDEKSKGRLDATCGHHCGVITTGAHAHEGHCDCPECHGELRFDDYEVPSEFTMQPGGVDPRGIS